MPTTVEDIYMFVYKLCLPTAEEKLIGTRKFKVLWRVVANY